MWNPPTPLSPNEQNALERLKQSFDADTDMFAREVAVKDLIDADFEQPEAQDLIEQLLSKGYLYEAENGLRITEAE